MQSLILFLHLLGATIWTGGHLIVTFTVLPRALRDKDPQRLLDFEGSYERLGMPALITQVLTGLWLAYQLMPNVMGWFDSGNPVSHLILCKLALLLGTALVALDAKTRIIPHLTPETLHKMKWRVWLVTLFSVLFVLVGASFRGGMLMPWL